MNENPNIDELLNSFIDGELTPTEQTEVQRLIARDAEVAQRVRQLQECKKLLGSLPVAEAPVQVLEQTKASLAERGLLDEQPSAYNERTGARYLLVRRVTAAAAMIGLVAVLTAVIYTIVSPKTTVPEGPVAIGHRQPAERVEAVRPGPSTVAAEFSGRLELKTSALVAVDAFISRAIEDNGLSDLTSPVRQRDKRIYSVSCSNEGLKLLLADLEGIWAELSSATLFVDTEVFGRQVAVEAVTTEQIAEIVNQDSSEKCVEVAKDLAVLNNMAERLPGREILAVVDDRSRSSITIPKPVLTWNQKTVKKPSGQSQGKKTIHLTIAVDR